MKTLKKALFAIAGICLLMACSKSDRFWGDDYMGSDCRGIPKPVKKYSPGTIYQLEGLALYITWTVKEGMVIQDNKWECTGEIEFLEDRNFRFSFQETRPDGNGMTFYGKFSASGILNFKFPAPVATLPDGTELYVTDIIKSHGCVTALWGPGINEGTLIYKGRFDGRHLYAEARFMAMVNENCPDMLNPPYNGAVHWIFGNDMTVK